MRTLALFLAAALLPMPALAAPHASSAEAQVLLDKAVTEISTVGAPKALAEFNDAKGAFHTKELYVFVLTLNGVWEAYGADPALVGVDAHDMTDAEGTPLVQRMIAVAKDPGQGRVDYVWRNPADNRVEHKRSFIRRVGDHIVGVGYYAG